MTSDLTNGRAGGSKAKRTRIATPQAELDRGRTQIDVERSGDWMPADELRGAALSALVAGNDVTVNVGSVDHLDASALQILLALDAEQKKRGRNLEVANASPHLRQWFEYAGAADRFSMTDRKSDE